MAPLQQELSRLEVEPLEVVPVPESEQESSLETLTTLSDVEVAALLTGTLPFNDPNTPNPCCCCCCPCCCC